MTSRGQSTRAVLFDLGDTIIQYGRVDRTGLFESAARRTYRMWSERQRRMPGYRRYYLHQWFAMYWCHMKLKLLGRELNAMRYIRRACRKLWLTAPDGFFDELAWQWYRPLAEVATIEPNTRDVLADLRAAGLSLIHI